MDMLYDFPFYHFKNGMLHFNLLSEFQLTSILLGFYVSGTWAQSLVSGILILSVGRNHIGALSRCAFIGPSYQILYLSS